MQSSIAYSQALQQTPATVVRGHAPVGPGSGPRRDKSGHLSTASPPQQLRATMERVPRPETVAIGCRAAARGGAYQPSGYAAWAWHASSISPGQSPPLRTLHEFRSTASSVHGCPRALESALQRPASKDLLCIDVSWIRPGSPGSQRPPRASKRWVREHLGPSRAG